MAVQETTRVRGPKSLEVASLAGAIGQQQVLQERSVQAFRGQYVVPNCVLTCTAPIPCTQRRVGGTRRRGTFGTRTW